MQIEQMNEKIEFLLEQTQRMITYEKKKEQLKGEKFNIFSILGLEKHENRTHSAFIKELIDPYGSHLKDRTFLKLFLEVISDSRLELNSTRVQVEKNIGRRNDVTKEGGRVDIFLSDKKGRSISIENKIYAGDQIAQIERYYNYNKLFNCVFYLTLHGDEPIGESKGQLEAGKDFYLISYKEHILAWLQKCIKETTDNPILRETIKQYILLIKKLTSTMEITAEKELIDLMLRYYEEASYISANFIKARQTITEIIRQEVLYKLNLRLSDRYVIESGEPTQNKYSQIWVKIQDHLHSKLYFGIESFSGEGNYGGHLFVGIFDHTGGKCEYASYNDNTKLNGWWTNPALISDFENHEINFNNPEILKNVYNNAPFKQRLIDHIVEEVEQYIKEQSETLIKYIKENNL